MILPRLLKDMQSLSWFGTIEHLSPFHLCGIDWMEYIFYMKSKWLPHFPESRSKQNLLPPPTTSRFLCMSIPRNGPMPRSLIPCMDLRVRRECRMNWPLSHPLKALLWSGESIREQIQSECFPGNSETVPVERFSFAVVPESASEYR